MNKPSGDKKAGNEFVAELATPADDQDILRLLGTNPTPGRVALTFERSPSYFLSSVTMGTLVQPVVVRHRLSREIAAMACRAVRPRWVNGKSEDVGYLTDLIVHPSFRGRWLVSSLFRSLIGLHADRRTAGYVTIIAEENALSKGLLVDRPRTHFPVYREVAQLRSLALILWRRKSVPQSSLELSRGSPTNLREIVACLQRHGAAKQFFPVYTEADFRSGAPLTLDFRLEDLLVARRNGEIVGLIGLWDRSRTKQMVVRAYSHPLGWLRPGYSAIGRWVGIPTLPAPGQPAPLAYASFICVEGNNPDLFRLLLRHLYNLAVERRYAYLVIDLASQDPLLAVAQEYRHFTYRRRLYAVSYRDQPDLRARLDGRIPYMDTAAL